MPLLSHLNMRKYLYFLFYFLLPVYGFGDIITYDSLEHVKAVGLFDQGYYSRSKTGLIDLLEKSTPGTSEYIFLLSDLGNIYLHQHEYAIARDLFRAGIDQAQRNPQLKEDVTYANLVFRYATAEAHLQNNLAAIIGFDEVRMIYNEVYGQQHVKTISIILEIAELYLKIGSPDKASSFLDESEALMTSSPDQKPNEINALMGRARYFYYTSNYDESLRLLNASLTIIESQSGKRSSEYLSILPFVGKCMVRTGSLDSAKLFLESSLKEIGEMMGPHHPVYLETKVDYANILWKTGDYANAFASYKELFAEHVRQYELFFYSTSYQDRSIRYNKIEEIHEKLASLIELNPNERLIDAFLHMTILFKNIPSHPRSSEALASDPLIKSWKDNLEKLWSDYQLPVSSLAKGMDEISRQEKTISKQSQSISRKGILRKNHIFIKDPLVSDIRKELDSTQVAIEIIRYRQYTGNEQFTDSIRYAYLVYSQKKSVPIKYAVNTNGYLLEHKYLTYYRSSIKNRFIDEYAYSNYWSPISALVGESSNLVIAPDGAYIQINLSTLRNPESHTYLGDEHSIQLVTSSSDLLATNKPNPNKKREVYIFGNPAYEMQMGSPGKNELELYTSSSSSSGMRYMKDGIKEHHTWSELLYKDKLKTYETDLLSALYESIGFDVHSFLRNDALESNIKKLQSPFIAHLSLHGYFMENQDFNPNIYQENKLLHSGILFAGSTSFLEGNYVPTDMDDGILTSLEINSLDLINTELVFLSSCETGIGIVSNDNSIKSLERAFQFAGARSVIMSLWTTEAEYEIEFMNFFYYYWLFEEMSKRDAFIQAQDNMKKAYDRPYYWGSFILLGE